MYKERRVRQGNWEETKKNEPYPSRKAMGNGKFTGKIQKKKKKSSGEAWHRGEGWGAV